MEKKDSAEKAVREIRKKTRRRFSAEEKIRIVLEGLRGKVQINSPHMIYAKEKAKDAKGILGKEKLQEIHDMPGMPKGHEYYEKFRTLPDGDPAKQAIADESKAYYNAVRKAAGEQ
jgi:hypothetical protein